MRRSKADSRRVVNALAEIRFSRAGLTSYAGLELVRVFCGRIGFRGMVQRCVAPKSPASDFGATSIVLLLVALLVVGGRRVRHLGYMSEDPIVERFCGLSRLPSVRSVNRWLAATDQSTVDGLRALNQELVATRIDALRLKRLTIDVDGSVIEAGRRTEGARRGYSPLRRRKPSYYPITAYEAQTGALLDVQNRPGNVHDGKSSIDFLQRLIADLRARYGRRPKLEFRMDGAFFLREVVDLLEREEAEYAIKVPFWPWLGIKSKVAAQTDWRTLDTETDFFETELEAPAWKRTFRVVILRKKVHHRSSRNYQLDLFDPSNGYWEYAAIATNKPLGAAALRAFVHGRGTHEKVLGELKSSFAFDIQPSQRLMANSSWQMLSAIAFNLMRAFQANTLAPERPSNAKRRTRHLFAHIDTLRYQALHRAGALRSPQGKTTLDVGSAPAVVQTFSRILQKLLPAA